VLGEEHPDTLMSMSNLPETSELKAITRRRGGSGAGAGGEARACWARSIRTR